MGTLEGISGKVAEILNKRESVINRGAEHGVESGMIFKVMEPEVVVTDPDTNDELGVIRREKIRVKVVSIEDRFSIAQTFETYTVPSKPCHCSCAILVRHRETRSNVMGGRRVSQGCQ